MWLDSNLDRAARLGDFALTKLLLQTRAAAGGTSSACTTYADDGSNDGVRGERSLFASAAFGGNPDIVTALVQAFAGGPHYPGRAVRSGSHKSIIADVNKLDPMTGLHPIHIATNRGHRAAVRALLYYGADVNTAVDFDSSSSSSSTRSSSWPRTLLRGMTSLHWAAFLGHWEIVGDLIMNGADLNARVSHSGESPLHLAARLGRTAAVGVLLDAGATPTLLSRSNMSPLDLAACNNRADTVCEFLSRGLDPNSKNPLGYTALHQAAYMNAGQALEVLIRAGGSLSSVTDAGRTPLHVAAFSSHAPGPSGSAGGFGGVAATAAAAAAAGDTKKSNSSSSSSSKSEVTGTSFPPSSSSSYYSAMDVIARHIELAGVDAVDASGATPLRVACVSLREKAIQDLLRMGADEKLVRLSPDGGGGGGGGGDGGGGGGGGGGVERTERIARVMAMLAAAPRDRAWRRRGWLPLLLARVVAVCPRRSLASMLVILWTGGGSGGGGGGGGGGHRSSSSCSNSSTNTSSSSSSSRTSSTSSNGNHGEKNASTAGGGRGGRDAGLMEAVARTLLLDDDSVFRQIVTFL
ncbi:unnamed protein product [Laminaria digitata]